MMALNTNTRNAGGSGRDLERVTAIGLFRGREEGPPALRPPDWGLRDVAWAHRALEAADPGIYGRRLQELHRLEVDARSVTPLHGLHGGQLLRVFGALYGAFGEAQSITGFRDLEGSKGDVSWFTDRTLIRHATRGKDAAAVNPDRLRRLGLRDAEDFELDVPGYRRVPDQEKDFLNCGAALLLLPAKHDPTLVVVTLKPLLHAGIPDERYFDFFQRLRDGNVSYAWNQELADLMLGCYDAVALGTHGLSPHTRRFIFPQYEGTRFEKAADPIAAECRVEAETALAGVARKDEINRPTEKYRDIMARLGQLDISLGHVFDDFEEIKNFLSQEQIQKVALGVANVIFDYLKRGQIKCLSALDRLPEELSLHVEMSPHDARELRRFYQSLSPEEVLVIGACFQADGTMGQYCSNLSMPGTSPDVFPRINGDEWSMAHHPEGIKDPNLQAKLRQRACCYLSHALRGTVETESLVDMGQQIAYYSPILKVMCGRSEQFEPEDSNRVSALVAVRLVHFLEHSVGLRLPELRSQVARLHEKSRALLELTPFERDGVPLPPSETQRLLAIGLMGDTRLLTNLPPGIEATREGALEAASRGQFDAARQIIAFLKDRYDGTSLTLPPELKRLDVRLRVMNGRLSAENVMGEIHFGRGILEQVTAELEQGYGKPGEVRKTIEKWSAQDQWGLDGYKLCLCAANRKLLDLFYQAADTLSVFEERGDKKADGREEAVKKAGQHYELARSIAGEAELELPPALEMIGVRLKIYNGEVSEDNLEAASGLAPATFKSVVEEVGRRVKEGEDWHEIGFELKKAHGLGAYTVSAFMEIHGKGSGQSET